VDLAQVVRFLVVKLNHQIQILDLTYVLYLWLIIFLVGGDIPVDNDELLVTDFVNLKIKPTQSFGGTHKYKMCVCVYMMSARTCMQIYVCTVFFKNNLNEATGEDWIPFLL
jgi:hypothetical protein